MRFWERLLGIRLPHWARSPKEPEPRTSKKSLTTQVSGDSRTFFKGKDFEIAVESLLRDMERCHSTRVRVTPQARLQLNDGRIKYIDFAFDYVLASSDHQVAIECQDRKAWSTEIVDKILTMRNLSYRNRFWFVYRDDDFLSPEGRGVLEKHGIMHFSLSVFRAHLEAVRRDLSAADILDEIQRTRFIGGKFVIDSDAEARLKRLEEFDAEQQRRYKPPSDSAMVAG